MVLVINVIALLAWGKVFHHFDVYTIDKKNGHKLFWLIITGGVVNFFLTYITYPYWESILYTFTGLYYDMNHFVADILIVGPVEESTKFLSFIFLTAVFKSIKEPRDGVLQAASVGLGFAIMENFYYGYHHGLIVLAVRSVVTIMGHVSYAAIWGLGWGAYLYTSDGKTKTTDRFFILPLLLVSALFHGLYDFLLDTGLGWQAFVFDGVTMAVFLLFYRYVRDHSPYRAFSLKDYKKAVPALKTGLKRHPESYVLNKRLGIFRIYTRHYKSAVKNLEKAVKLQPGSTESRYYCGAALFLSGNKEKGLAMMDSVIKGLAGEQRGRLNGKLRKVVNSPEAFDKIRACYDLEKGRYRKDAAEGKIYKKLPKNRTLWQKSRLPANRKRYYRSSLDREVARYKAAAGK